jgi:muramidase (phage lysozyme)
MADDPNAITGIAPVAPPVAPLPVPLPSVAPPAPTPPSVTGSPWDPQGAGLAASRRIAAADPSYAPVQNQSIPAEGRALLGVIGSKGFESNGSYTQRFNQPDFEDFGQHPGTYGKITSGPNRGKQSNAAGRYQFLSTTWADQAKKLNLKDFSPESQDKAAWNLAQETYAAKYKGRDLATDLKNPGKLNQVAGALRSQWTSLPGGIESGRSNLKKFSQGYSSALAKETARTGASQFAQPARRPNPLYTNPRSPVIADSIPIG